MSVAAASINDLLANAHRCLREAPTGHMVISADLFQQAWYVSADVCYYPREGVASWMAHQLMTWDAPVRWHFDSRHNLHLQRTFI